MKYSPAPNAQLPVDFKYEWEGKTIYVQHNSTGVRLSLGFGNMIWLEPHEAAQLACEIHAAAMAVIDYRQKEN